MELKFKIGDKTYEVDKITLGEARFISQEFGVDNLAQYEWSNPNYLAACVYLGFKRKEPYLMHGDLMARVDQVDLNDLVQSVGDAVVAQTREVLEGAGADPQEAAEAATGDGSGKPATKKKPRGKSVVSGD